MEENKDSSMIESIKISSKKGMLKNFKALGLFVLFCSIFYAILFLIFWKRTPFLTKNLFLFVLCIWSVLFSYIFYLKKYFKFLDDNKKYIVNMLVLFIISISFFGVSFFSRYYLILSYVQSLSVFFVFLIVISYVIPFLTFSLIFDRSDYIKYSYKYFYYNVFFNFIIVFLFFVFNYSFLSDEISYSRLFGMIVYSFMTILLSIGFTSLYSIVFCAFQPLISVVFFVTEKKIFPKETKKYAVYIWWLFLIAYLAIPDLYHVFVIDRIKEGGFIENSLFRSLFKLSTERVHFF